LLAAALPAAGAAGVFVTGAAAAGALLAAAGAAVTGALREGVAVTLLLLPAPAAGGTLDTGAGAVTGCAAVAVTAGLVYAIGYKPSPSPSALPASETARFCFPAAGAAALLPASSRFLKLSPSKGRCSAASLRAPARSVMVGRTSMMCSSVLSTTPACTPGPCTARKLRMPPSQRVLLSPFMPLGMRFCSRHRGSSAAAGAMSDIIKHLH
jgi:hypothetical protein